MDEQASDARHVPLRAASPRIAPVRDAAFPEGGAQAPKLSLGRPAASLGRLGSLEVRLARSDDEVLRAQALRYRVFFGEGSARADPRTMELRRDADGFDPFCDHLLVLNHDSAGPGSRREIVGTYRLLRQEIAERHCGFYTAGEYDIAPLLARKRGLRFLELGRSCVLPAFRNKRTLELLWHGIWAYVLMHRMDVMIGCASLEGADPDRHAAALSFLHRQALAPPEWLVRACKAGRVEMKVMGSSETDPRAALRAVPPLIKGYLRLGAFVGDGAVVDRAFGTTDVCIVLPVSGLNPRYVRHYGMNARRFAS